MSDVERQQLKFLRHELGLLHHQKLNPETERKCNVA